MLLKFRLFIFLLFLLEIQTALSQTSQVQVDLYPSELKLDENLTILVYINATEQYEVSDFPDLPNFRKLTRSTKHGQTQINGKKVEQHIISQVYSPEKSGKIILPNFNLIVNNKTINVEAFTVNVKSNEDFSNNIEIEEVDLILDVSKSKVFTGEGIKVNLGFYLSDKTTTQWQFPDNISDQLEEISKKIKPQNCLESRSEISNIVGQKVIINQKSYTFYKLFEAIYYPLNDKKIDFPVVNLAMQKQQNRGNFVSLNLKTKSKLVFVKKLPEYSLREQVSVGNYNMNEFLKGSQQYTGNSFDYKIVVNGTGNFNTVNLNKLESNKQFEFFANTPKVIQNNGQLEGSKEFSFKIIPKDSGTFQLSNYFNLIYFNSEKQIYDTLKSSQIIRVSGHHLATDINEIKDIYSNIDNLKTDTKSFSIKDFTRVFGNFMVVIMTLLFVYILKYKNNE